MLSTGFWRKNGTDSLNMRHGLLNSRLIGNGLFGGEITASRAATPITETVLLSR